MITTFIQTAIIAFLLLRLRSLKQQCAILSSACQGMYEIGRRDAFQETMRTASEAEKAAYLKGIQDTHAALKPRKIA